MTLEEYYNNYGTAITQASERLFVDDFLYPLLGSNISAIVPQHPFIDRSGKCRRIDFAYNGHQAKLALEVNGETYHAEGIIPDAMFDDNLFRQNEILRSGYQLVRFSYSQLQSPAWRDLIKDTLRDLFKLHAPELLTTYALAPNPIQQEALDALAFYRGAGARNKGVVILPTGTGKTILSAMDARRVGGRTLFLVHRLDILKQSMDAYSLVWPQMRPGLLTGDVKENELDCDVLFASKDTLRQPATLQQFPEDWFEYVVVDEVHHGQSPSYQDILKHFKPQFMLGMTATPDRTDRKDILELFDYNKVYEIPLSDVIERGLLVPFTYHGLTDNVDYSRIRYQGHRYNVADLERQLIIEERNDAILKEYLDKGHGDKAIGFCVSIEHANRMADFFNEHGVSSASIHSQSQNRDDLVAQFRNNELQVVFTVDLFNEGIDFPNVQVLLFLRPTESKTVFLQQLGRGLRLCPGKDRVRILDFIGNYRRANQIRKFLSKDSRQVLAEEDGRRKRKILYEYSTGCEVHFDDAVEEILNRQDAEDLGISKEDLTESYFALAEELGRKPTRADLDNTEYPSQRYVQLYGSWLGFLREIGEYTEASYHYPQGTHLGHVLSILYYFGSGNRAGSPFDDEYIRMRGGLGEGRLATYRRQIKYKLQAAMELGILSDDRHYANDEYVMSLTPLGQKLYDAFEPFLRNTQLDLERGADGIPTTRMEVENEINQLVLQYATDHQLLPLLRNVLLSMSAVQQMLTYLYQIERQASVPRKDIYERFFESPKVRQFCEREGIEQATIEASRRRCPFLLNILEACGITQSSTAEIRLTAFVISKHILELFAGEDEVLAARRKEVLANCWPNDIASADADVLLDLRELFGPQILTDDYYLKELVVLEN